MLIAAYLLNVLSMILLSILLAFYLTANSACRGNSYSLVP
jgi:hypothetical protein